MNPIALNYNANTKTISNIMLPKSFDELLISADARESISHWIEPASRTSPVGGKILIAASIAIGTMIPSFASAADIFVRDARGATAQTPSSTDISDMVKSAVESMPEHQLVESEANADFVLRPRIVNRATGMVLHIDRYRGETLLSSSEEPLPKVESDQDGAYTVVTEAFKGNDMRAAQNGNDRAMTPTYAEAATQTRGDQSTPATGAANTDEMARSHAGTQRGGEMNRIGSSQYAYQQNSQKRQDSTMNQTSGRNQGQNQGQNVGQNRIQTQDQTQGSRRNSRGDYANLEPAQGNIAPNSADASDRDTRANSRATPSADVPAGDTSYENLNSRNGQEKPSQEQTQAQNQDQSQLQNSNNQDSQVGPATSGPSAADRDSSQDQADDVARGTAGTPEQPMKTATIPSSPASGGAQGNQFGHPMNPGAGMDLPASDYGTAGAGEMRTDGFKRSSVFGGPGYFTAAAGASFAGGLGADNTMVDVNAGYAIDYTPLITGKAFVDMNLGTGSDVARFIDLAVGANYYPPQVQSTKSKPYVGGDLGLGLARNNLNSSQASLAVGATGGFQFLADMANLDVGLRYEVLATQIDGATAQLLGLKVGMNF